MEIHGPGAFYRAGSDRVSCLVKGREEVSVPDAGQAERPKEGLKPLIRLNERKYGKETKRHNDSVQ